MFREASIHQGLRVILTIVKFSKLKRHLVFFKIYDQVTEPLPETKNESGRLKAIRRKAKYTIFANVLLQCPQ
ncbi:hypothetical protein CWATWH8502_2434 [Crocosphaera watsonii WH 8502]|uniref:Uncharacterized protein n=1 Tax=Crocosphaera watsonii WH 8502 TaxID=423474 RepID=T2IBE3_CROWT|nr:hypothetical protein CWATWH8502_2434 [Crocosphaera watsonii WH 8502]